MRPGYRQNPRAPGVRAPFNGTTEVPGNLRPILRTQEPPPPIQSIPVLDRVMIEEAVYFVRWIELNATAAGNTTVLQGVGGKKLTVVSIEFVVAAAVTVAWNSGINVARNAQSFAANSGIARDIVRPYYVQTNSGEDLIIVLGGAVQVRGSIGYVQVGA